MVIFGQGGVRRGTNVTSIRSAQPEHRQNQFARSRRARFDASDELPRCAHALEAMTSHAHQHHSLL